MSVSLSPSASLGMICSGGAVVSSLLWASLPQSWRSDSHYGWISSRGSGQPASSIPRSATASAERHSPTRIEDRRSFTTPADGPARRVDPRVSPGRVMWMTFLAPTGMIITTTVNWIDSRPFRHLPFCPTCDSTMHWIREGGTSLLGMAVGNFVDPGFPAPKMEIHIEMRHTWVRPAAGAKQLGDVNLKSIRPAGDIVHIYCQ
jgi:hypothetical protein